MADLGKNVQLRNDQYLMTDSCKILTEKLQISRGYGVIGMTGCFGYICRMAQLDEVMRLSTDSYWMRYDTTNNLY